ncbi:MAG: radical SAM family heme chaperone HemW [Bacteroidales bacterium]|nr:radical SAM family heme chaperone HemW [Bacteroidales bacterium]
MAGIYLHIPFCNSKCIYCGFYSVVNREIREKFVPALRREISLRRNFFDTLPREQRSIKTLYIGGGTPSVLPASTLAEIVTLLKENFSFPDSFEFTVEVNPDDITKEYAEALKNLGINRVSMGVQSFEDSHLRWMARRHNAKQAEEAFAILRDAGFENISADLIFGFPLLSMAQWESNLKKLISLSPEHISAYQLSIDENTALERLASRGDFIPSDEAACSLQYAMLQSILKEAGYEQYEISNFAKRGFYSRHNSGYWERNPYLGLGPGAHSFIGNKREWNFNSVEDYCREDLYEIRQGESLTERDIYNETLMLGLRKSEGVAIAKLLKSCKSAPLFFEESQDVFKRYLSTGILIKEDGKIKIPPGKFFVSDGIIRDLFV